MINTLIHVVDQTFFARIFSFFAAASWAFSVFVDNHELRTMFVGKWTHPQLQLFVEQQLPHVEP